MDSIAGLWDILIVLATFFIGGYCTFHAKIVWVFELYQMNKKNRPYIDKATLELNGGDSSSSDHDCGHEHSEKHKRSYSPAWLYIKNFTFCKRIFIGEKKSSIEKKFLQEYVEYEAKFDKQMDYCYTLQNFLTMAMKLEVYKHHISNCMKQNFNKSILELYNKKLAEAYRN